MATFFTVLVLVLATAAGARDEQLSGQSEAANKERLYQQALDEFRRAWSATQTNLPVELRDVGLTNPAYSAEIESMFRGTFEADWIHSSFGLRWDEIPPPTIRSTNATTEVERFVAENGWDMLTNKWVFLISVERRGKPIRGLPWEVIRERTFKAVTCRGILYVPLRASWPMGSSGVAYNPHTNQFHWVSAFKHIGDHWYVWRQSDTPSDSRSFYEGETRRSSRPPAE